MESKNAIWQFTALVGTASALIAWYLLCSRLSVQLPTGAIASTIPNSSFKNLSSPESFLKHFVFIIEEIRKILKNIGANHKKAKR